MRKFVKVWLQFLKTEQTNIQKAFRDPKKKMISVCIVLHQVTKRKICLHDGAFVHSCWERRAKHILSTCAVRSVKKVDPAFEVATESQEELVTHVSHQVLILRGSWCLQNSKCFCKLFPHGSLLGLKLKQARSIYLEYLFCSVICIPFFTWFFFARIFSPSLRSFPPVQGADILQSFVREQSQFGHFLNTGVVHNLEGQNKASDIVPGNVKRIVFFAQYRKFTHLFQENGQNNLNCWNFVRA